MGDRLGTPGAVGFFFFLFLQFHILFISLSLSHSLSLSLVLLSPTLKANAPVKYFNNSCRVQHSSRQTMTKCAQRVDEFVLALPLRLGQIIPSSGAHCWFWSGFLFLLGFFFFSLSFFPSFSLSLFLPVFYFLLAQRLLCWLRSHNSRNSLSSSASSFKFSTLDFVNGHTMVYTPVLV